MIELTQEQRRELQQPEPLAVDPETKEQFVLVRKDVYDRIRHLIEDEISLSKREVAALVQRAMREYDENDPTLNLYQDD
jgi:hypothetical protein